MDFTIWPYRLHFVAWDELRFPPGRAGNVIRGALGTLLRGLCVPACADPCPFTCPYKTLFAPRQAGGPSGFATPPRPFVLRAFELDGRTLAAGESFCFDLILFSPGLIPDFVRAFETWDRALLARVEPLPVRVFGFEAVAHAPSRIVVSFLSPTELKSDGEVAGDVPFELLFRRLRDRISGLRALYQGGPLEIDFAGLGAEARAVSTVRSSLRLVKAERRSSRTGQRHALGGLVGEVEYEGDFSRLLPYLKAGEWTGVGRQTVWGKGCMRCDGG